MKDAKRDSHRHFGHMRVPSLRGYLLAGWAVASGLILAALAARPEGSHGPGYIVAAEPIDFMQMRLAVQALRFSNFRTAHAA